MNVEIIPRNIPLLLSHDSMKHAKIQLNFENNTIRAFQKSINLTFTRSGHYAVPITNPKHMLNDVNSSNQHNDTPWYDEGSEVPPPFKSGPLSSSFLIFFPNPLFLARLFQQYHPNEIQGKNKNKLMWEKYFFNFRRLKKQH